MSTFLTEVYCENCMRRCVRTEVFQRGNLKTRKKFSHIRSSGPRLVRLCKCCSEFLTNERNESRNYWPSMIYEFLSMRVDLDENMVTLSFRDKWRLIPCSWRSWWEGVFTTELASINGSIEPAFRDVTTEKRILEEAIEKLTWVDLAKAIDRHLAFPEVRCPFGCSEFLHKTNAVPFEDFLFHFSNYQMTSYCKNFDKRTWTDCILPSYPSSAKILHKFSCTPCIVISDEGPMILTCREHSRSSKESYIHVPESATGTIYTPNANAFAPVVSRPRTNRNFKRNVRSDTYCTVDQVGGYNGIDSSYITSSNVLRCDPLSAKRDALSVEGRPDIKAQLYDRCLNRKCPSFIPKGMIDQIVSYSEKEYGGPLSNLSEWNTSSYIPCDVAVQLQEKAYGDVSQNIKVYESVSDMYEEEIFDPPWPLYFVPIHPMDDHGQRIQRVMEADFGLWQLLVISGRVFEVWESLARSVTDNRGWQGHWLRFATGELGFKSRKCDIFKKLKKHEIKTKIRGSYGVDVHEILKDRDRLSSLFGMCSDILVCAFHLPPDNELCSALKDKDIIFCLHHKRPVAGEESRVFELRCLLSAEDEADRNTFEMNVKHAGKKMWCQHGTSYCRKSNLSEPSDYAWRNSTIAVYCRKLNANASKLVRKYMNIIGGQTTVYCRTHKCPLIVNHEKKVAGLSTFSRSCVCKSSEDSDQSCGQFGCYVCPYNCGTSICVDHWRSVKDECEKTSAETAYFLSSSSESVYHEISDTDNGAIRNVVEDDSMEVECLGPTESFEIAQDMLECDLSSDGSSICSEVLLDVNELGVGDQSVDLDITEEFENAIDATTEQGRRALGLDLPYCSEIPCTSGFEGPNCPDVRVENSDPSAPRIPLYVMLNMQGHLLTRSRSKLRMNKAQRAVFEKLVARSTSRIVPLVYGEAQLFPSVFWQSLRDGSIPGAIPTALWCDAKTLGNLGIASLRQHSKQRITNPALLTSVDPAYHFHLMDVNVNLSLRGKDTRVIMNRGFADKQGSDGINFREKSDAAEFYGETSENHANVHKLSALVRESSPHYFFTQSCNQESCQGLKILRDWITSDDAIFIMQMEYGLSYEDAGRFLRESAASYVLRSWNEVADMWMRYIIYSSEAPLGEIEWAWYRKEFQEKQGNVSHIHAILKTIFDIRNPDGLKAVLTKIRGCVADLVHTMEAEKFKEMGFISSAEHLLELLEKARAYLTHRCHERCQIPKTDKNGNTIMVCKVNDNVVKTVTPHIHTLQTIEVHHTSEARDIYNRLGFMFGNAPIDVCLKSERHIPICSASDPKFSPTNGHLFLCFPSSQNLQFTTGHAIAAYLVKYVAGFDEVAVAAVRSLRRGEMNEVQAVVESLKNTKITSNKIRANKKKSKHRKTARILTQMECLTVVLGADLVTSTVPFIKLPTAPREYRSALIKKTDRYWRRIDDFLEEDIVYAQQVRERKGFPVQRRFSQHQIDVILDERESSLSMDAITVFSIRPPELRFVNNPRLYFRWFRRVVLNSGSYEERQEDIYMRLHKDFGKCEWIDGVDVKVLLYRGAIDEIVDYIDEQCDADVFGSAVLMRTTKTHFDLIRKLYWQFDLGIQLNRRNSTRQSSLKQYKMISEKFLCKEKMSRLPTVWSTPVYPKNRGRFLVSLLLLFGRFETEYELMLQGDMKQAYVHASLFDPNRPQDSFDELLKRYIRECLSFLPGSIYQRDRNLVFAESALAEVLLDESGRTMDTPCVLQSHMYRSNDLQVNEFRRDQIECFIDSLYDDLNRSGFSQTELPCKQDVLKINFPDVYGKPSGRVEYRFPPRFDRQGPQSSESYIEQRKMLLKAKNMISRYSNGLSHKNMVVCGGPGNGKTTVCAEICLYAFSQGLKGMVTSLIADRSKALGGIHIHKLCSVPVSERGGFSPGRAAESAIAAIYRKPNLMYLWQGIDFLFIDEFGAVSAELLATIDIIARHVKESSRFFGGMLLIASMDPRQLLPVSGTPVMLSMNMMTEFTFTELRESVRASNDENLRRLCSLSRTLVWTEQQKTEFRNLIKNCNFVASFDDERIPKDAIFVFSRKAPCRSVEESILSRINNSGARLVCSESVDEESSVAGNWKSASNSVRKQLSKKVKEKQQLYFFEKGRYEFTYNLDGKFQQGQLAILLHLDEQAIQQKDEIELYRAPPGCKEFPTMNNCTHEHLTSNGWKVVMVPFECTGNKRVRNQIVARRSQYGVRLRIASTIHGSQGSTYNTLVTAVTNRMEDPDLNFTLWEAAQVVVLISRTRRCSDIYFIGNANEVAEQLLSVLMQGGRFLSHLQALTERLCGNQDNAADTSMIFTRPPLFRPCDIVLESVPAVYLLVSTRHVGYMYIGETKNIRIRLTQHNSGQGSNFTNNERLRPWALFGYISGFRGRRERLIFEKYWKCKALEYRQRRRTAMGVLQIGINLACVKNRTRTKDFKLFAHQCGELVQNEPEVTTDDSVDSYI